MKVLLLVPLKWLVFKSYWICYYKTNKNINRTWTPEGKYLTDSLLVVLFYLLVWNFVL